MRLSLHYNGEIRDEKTAALERWRGWLVPLQPRYQSRTKDCLRFSAGNPENDRITGMKERATFGPKLPLQPRDLEFRDPGYRRTPLLCLLP
jgi:hypothetical protein